MTDMEKRPGQGAPDVTTTSESTGDALTPEETAHALDIARELVKAGVPVFVAAPDSNRPGGFLLPRKWEQTRPNESVVDLWRPGFALCAVGGHVADFLDVDPRNGGDASEREVRAAGHWPRSFGRQTTPSGGTHDIISVTGERKATNLLPGLDLQSGAADGTGRGFAYISPTVRPSKVDGVPRPYRWEVKPDVEALDEYRGADDSTEGIVAHVHAKRAGRKSTDTKATSGTAADAPDAVRRVMQLRDELAATGDGANDLAARLAWNVGQYVGAGQIDAEQATGIMLSALDGWTYAKPGDDHTMENTIRSQVAKGSEFPRAWTAARAESTNSGAAPFNLASAADEMMARLIGRDTLDNLPPITPLVAGLLDLDSESWIIGPPGGYKSFVSLDIACHVATGMEWRGRKVTQGPVVYVVAEGSKGIRNRVRAWEATYGRRAENVFFLAEPLRVQGKRGELSEEWLTLIEIVRRIRPALVVLDTQARITAGINENDAGEMGTFIRGVTRLKMAAGSCVLTVHHTGRSGGDARGSSAIDGAQDTELKVERTGRKEARAARLVQDKQKDRDDSTNIDFRMSEVVLEKDERTGLSVTSLALAPYDPFATADAVESKPAWERDLTGVKLEIMQVMREHSGRAGLTFAELDRYVNERRKERSKDAPALVKSTRSTAVTSLCGEDGGEALLVRDGKSRVVLPEFAEQE